MEVVLDARARLGECPLWSTVEDVLYWVDIDGRAVHRFDPATGRHQTRSLDVRPGSIALTSVPGRLLVAAEHELGDLWWESGTFQPWVALEEPGTGNRLNDGRADRAGRFWVGSMFERPDEGRKTGALYRVDPTGSVSIHRTGVGVSNALAFAPDGRTMYWADTPTGLVWSHPYDPLTGEPGRPDVLIDFSELSGLPDGACVDATGAIWIAAVNGGALVRVTPRGTIDRIVELPVGSPTMPAFGGPGLETMFITSIGRSESASMPGPNPIDGALLAWEPGVSGIAEPPVERGRGQ